MEGVYWWVRRGYRHQDCNSHQECTRMVPDVNFFWNQGESSCFVIFFVLYGEYAASMTRLDTRL